MKKEFITSRVGQVSFLGSREEKLLQATLSKDKTIVSTTSRAERVQIEFRSLKTRHDNVSNRGLACYIHTCFFARSLAKSRTRFSKKHDVTAKKISVKGKTILRSLIYQLFYNYSFLRQFNSC